jgi:hypothetical protein
MWNERNAVAETHSADQLPPHSADIHLSLVVLRAPEFSSK